MRNESIVPGVGKLWHIGHIPPAACICTACKLSAVVVYFRIEKKSRLRITFCDMKVITGLNLVFISMLLSVPLEHPTFIYIFIITGYFYTILVE